MEPGSSSSSSNTNGGLNGDMQSGSVALDAEGKRVIWWSRWGLRDIMYENVMRARRVGAEERRKRKRREFNAARAKEEARHRAAVMEQLPHYDGWRSFRAALATAAAATSTTEERSDDDDADADDMDEFADDDDQEGAWDPSRWMEAINYGNVQESARVGVAAVDYALVKAVLPKASTYGKASKALLRSIARRATDGRRDDDMTIERLLPSLIRRHANALGEADTASARAAQRRDDRPVYVRVVPVFVLPYVLDAILCCMPSAWDRAAGAPEPREITDVLGDIDRQLAAVSRHHPDAHHRAVALSELDAFRQSTSHALGAASRRGFVRVVRPRTDDQSCAARGEEEEGKQIHPPL
jgi:hypothetical protein